MNQPQRPVFDPSIVTTVGACTDLLTESEARPVDALLPLTKDWQLLFVNTMHMYLRVPVSLFDLYTRQFNTKLTVAHFELPKPLLTEDVQMPTGVAPPEPGWSRYVQGIPKEQYPHFQQWMVASKWKSETADGRRMVFDCYKETVACRDPAKLQLLHPAGLKEFVNIDFYLPASPGSRLYLNARNGPPFSCVYVSRGGPGTGEIPSLLSKAMKDLRG